MKYTTAIVNKALARTQLHERTASAVRSVLLQGMGHAEAALAHGLHRQAVSRAVAITRRAALQGERCPLCGAHHKESRA